MGSATSVVTKLYGEGIYPRKTATVTLDSVLPLASVNGVISLSPLAIILSVSSDYPSWIRLYNDPASRDADAPRAKYYRPRPGCGLVYDNIMVSSKLSISQSPIELFHNEDSPHSSAGYLAVMNLDSVSRAITVTINFLQKEA